MEGETGIGGDYQHARDAWAMGKARGEDAISHTPRASHSEPCALRGLTHQSLHTWSSCTVSLILGTWLTLAAHQRSGLGTEQAPEVAQCDWEGVELRAVGTVGSQGWAPGLMARRELGREGSFVWEGRELGKRE